jgi:hypothetical protein
VSGLDVTSGAAWSAASDVLVVVCEDEFGVV